MSNSYRRSQRMKNSHITSIVVGIFVLLGGLYFIFFISAETNRKNAECTEKTVGTVSQVSKSGSKYRTTIDYEIDGSQKSITVKAKKSIPAGSKIDVYYEPMSYSHLYIEGVSETGTSNIISGLIMVLAGVAFIALGILEMKKKKAAKNETAA